MNLLRNHRKVYNLDTLEVFIPEKQALNLFLFLGSMFKVRLFKSKIVLILRRLIKR